MCCPYPPCRSCVWQEIGSAWGSGSALRGLGDESEPETKVTERKKRRARYGEMGCRRGEMVSEAEVKGQRSSSRENDTARGDVFDDGPKTTDERK